MENGAVENSKFCRHASLNQLGQSETDTLVKIGFGSLNIFDHLLKSVFFFLIAQNKVGESKKFPCD